eukprot:CAMPEP_0172571280 /NCGR_PEP_ID=MMETSP1067-20121228/130727_1 /TAXON_ID=265564 ORGANISM="Thalassiosira punctigera, Strain Tpunct2005C2" /NCGR_SAMPLE_ID=MMETSP1067 /ASSEMBLY_ACC=CAM_ASM_000444 /LENGTH=151 /DNA_ID=CAMNT_0013363567 /DNA_START=543 /DNA_END=998 /DNA_ORIENTATION=-
MRTAVAMEGFCSLLSRRHIAIDGKVERKHFLRVLSGIYGAEPICKDGADASAEAGHGCKVQRQQALIIRDFDGRWEGLDEHCHDLGGIWKVRRRRDSFVEREATFFALYFRRRRSHAAENLDSCKVTKLNSIVKRAVTLDVPDQSTPRIRP